MFMTDTGTAVVERAVPESGELMLELIRTRRSIGKVTAEVPDKALIRQILEAGTWAPNHHLTEPWRFFVLEGDARARLGKVMGEVAAGREADEAKRADVAERAAGKPLRAPYVITIAVEPSTEQSVPEIEEIAAGCAAAQNMLLAAEALGLAAIWRTGWITFEPEVRAHFGLSERATVLGFVYVGFPAMGAPERARRSVEDVTTWLS